MKNFIEFKDVCFAYGTGKRVVNDISFKIDEGEFISLVGCNGSGKSTVARLINSTLIPTSGDVLVCGLNSKNFDSIFEIKKNIGLVFQNPENQIVSSIVEEDVAFALENLSISRERMVEAVEKSLKMVGIEKLKKSLVHDLSGGQKQKVAIAGVLAFSPKCIVFDEATAMLDPAGRRELVQIMTRLNKSENITIVNITHNMEEVVFSNRVVVLKDGIILKDASPVEIFSDSALLARAGLKLPKITELFNILWKKGLVSKKTVVDFDDAVASLYDLLK